MILSRPALRFAKGPYFGHGTFEYTIEGYGSDAHVIYDAHHDDYDIEISDMAYPEEDRCHAPDHTVIEFPLSRLPHRANE
jgi:hypothetical protein